MIRGDLTLIAESHLDDERARAGPRRGRARSPRAIFECQGPKEGAETMENRCPGSRIGFFFAADWRRPQEGFPFEIGLRRSGGGSEGLRLAIRRSREVRGALGLWGVHDPVVGRGLVLEYLICQVSRVVVLWLYGRG